MYVFLFKSLAVVFCIVFLASCLGNDEEWKFDINYDSDPSLDVRESVKNGDYRFISFNGPHGVEVPSIPDDCAGNYEYFIVDNEKGITGTYEVARESALLEVYAYYYNMTMADYVSESFFYDCLNLE